METGHSYFTVEIETENDAFAENKEMEISLILKDVANQVSICRLDDGYELPIMDGNGNKVGKAKFFVKKPEPRSHGYSRYEMQ
jgi:hypothetical protein